MRLFLLALVLTLALFVVPPGVAGASPPEIIGKAAILADSATGQVLYEKNSHLRAYPASVTKTLTAIIALEQGRLTDSVVVPPEASIIEGSAIGLKAGETLSLEDLLYALLLNSGNDSAVAIACHIGGSVDGFVGLMNKKARELGAVDSHFNNSNGLPDDNHYTTAYDLSLITRYAMQNPEFRKIVSTETKNISRSDPEAQTFLLNHNKLLWRYEGATGVKTGYTTQAGQCLAAAARRQDRELIAIVLDSEGDNIWSDTTSLLDYGFKQFDRVGIVEAGKQVAELPVRYGKEAAVIGTASALSYNFPAGKNHNLRQEMILAENSIAPVRAGDKLGELVFFTADKEIGRVDLIAQKAVGRKWYTYPWPWLFAVVLLAVLIWQCAAYQARARQKRWEAYYCRKRRWGI